MMSKKYQNETMVFEMKEIDKIFRRGKKRGFIAAGPMDIYAMVFFILVVIVFSIIFGVASLQKRGGSALAGMILEQEIVLDGNLMLSSYLKTPVEYEKRTYTLGEFISLGEDMSETDFTAAVTALSSDVLNPFIGSDNWVLKIVYPGGRTVHINRDLWEATKLVADQLWEGVKSSFTGDNSNVGGYAAGWTKIPSKNSGLIEVYFAVYGMTSYVADVVIAGGPGTSGTSGTSSSSISPGKLNPVSIAGCDIMVPDTNSKSIGRVSSGRLENAAEMPLEGEGYTMRSLARSRKSYYGTVEMVKMLLAGACFMKKNYDTKLNIGDMSQKDGGRCCRCMVSSGCRDCNHQTHQNGRSVDMCLFYNQDGKVKCDLIALSSDGYGSGTPLPKWDPRPNYEYVKFIVTNFEVKEVLLDKALQKSIISWAEANDPDKAAVSKVKASFRHVNGHHNHFHIDIKCAADDKPECIH